MTGLELLAVLHCAETGGSDCVLFALRLGFISRVSFLILKLSLSCTIASCSDSFREVRLSALQYVVYFRLSLAREDRY